MKDLKMANMFPYADIDSGSIAALIKVAPELASSTTPPTGLGFTLVKDILVPNTFLNDVEYELGKHARLNCFDVTRVSELFSESFFDSLTSLELSVLGECVLMLIEQGNVPISLIDPKKAA